MEDQLEDQPPVYSKINPRRGSNVHDYVDIDENDILKSNKTEEYCKMDPSPNLLLSRSPPTPPPSNSIPSDKPADRGHLGRRSFSVGPVNELYSYRKKKKTAGEFFSYDRYANQVAPPHDIMENSFYRSWYPNSQRPLIPMKDYGSYTAPKETMGVNKFQINREDVHSLARGCIAKRRPSIALCIIFIGIAAVLFLGLKVMESQETKAEVDTDQIKAILDFVSSSSDVKESDVNNARQREEVEFFGDSGKSKSRKPKHCCKHVKVSSSGIVAKMYPFLMGEYENHESAKDSPIYKKKNEERFLSRPYGFTKSGTHTYSWGINNRRTGKWGWIKAFQSGPCPHNIQRWKAFDEKSMRWIADDSFRISCIR